MKHFLTILAIVLCASTGQAQSYISSTGDIKLEGSSIKRFASPNIYVLPAYNPITQTHIVTLRIVDSSAFDSTIDEYTVTFTKAEINAFVGAGTGDTEKHQNAIEQAVVTYLEALNGTVFTIN
jgi:hypothetical protein